METSPHSPAVAASANGATSPAQDTGLDERYGRTPVSRRRARIGIWSAASAFVVVFGAWVIWGGLDGTTASADVLDTGFSAVDTHSVTVSWQLTLPPGTPASCAVQAQNEQHAIVGWKVIDVEPSAQRTRAFSETVNTTEQPVTGLIYRCWVT